MSSGVNPISIGKIPRVRSVNKKKDKGKRAFSLNDSIKTSNKTGFNQEINTENLYFLQTNSKDSDKEKDYNYGNNLLNLLSEYRKSMLFSKSSFKELNEIKENLKIYNISCTDKKPLDIIQEIETLASVELAKRGLI